MWPKVSVSLIKKHLMLIQEKLHASKSFWKIYPLKLGQTGALSGQTLVASPFPGYKQVFTAQTTLILVTMGANRGATVIHRVFTGLTTGHTEWRKVYQSEDNDVPGMCRVSPDAVPVETRLLLASSQFIMVFESLPGYSRLY